MYKLSWDQVFGGRQHLAKNKRKKKTQTIYQYVVTQSEKLTATEECSYNLWRGVRNFLYLHTISKITSKNLANFDISQPPPLEKFSWSTHAYTMYYNN